MDHDIQKLRNLTTGILHTEPEDVHHTLCKILGRPVLTQLMPQTIWAAQAYLKSQLPEPRFWNKQLDFLHIGVQDVKVMSEVELRNFVARLHDRQYMLQSEQLKTQKDQNDNRASDEPLARND